MITSISHKTYNSIEAVRGTRLLKLLDCPAAYNEQFAETPALLFGRAFHSFLLQPELFCCDYMVKPDVDGRTKEGKIALAEFSNRYDDLKKENESLSIISKDDMDVMAKMASSVLSHPTANEWLKTGTAEVPAVWTDQETGIKCKTLADWIIPDRIIDLKTIKKGHANLFSFYREAVYSYHYHVSGAMRLDGFLQNGHVYKDYSFIVVEKDPPYKVACFDLDSSLIEEGYNEYKRLLRELKQHLDANSFPSWVHAGSELLIANK